MLFKNAPGATWFTFFFLPRMNFSPRTEVEYVEGIHDNNVGSSVFPEFLLVVLFSHVVLV